MQHVNTVEIYIELCTQCASMVCGLTMSSERLWWSVVSLWICAHEYLLTHDLEKHIYDKPKHYNLFMVVHNAYE